MFGWTLAGIGSSGVPVEASKEAMDPPCATKKAQGFNWDLWKRSQTSGNGCKWMEMDGNGCKQTPNQAGSEVHIYLKAKTYD